VGVRPGSPTSPPVLGPAPARNVGELQLKGHVVMKGYHGDPSERRTVVDGWLRTGDLARRTTTVSTTSSTASRT